MNDRVINPLHLEFCVFNVGHVLWSFVSVSKKVSVHVWVKKSISPSGCTLFSGFLFFLFCFQASMRMCVACLQHHRR